MTVVVLPGWLFVECGAPKRSFSDCGPNFLSDIVVIDLKKKKKISLTQGRMNALSSASVDGSVLAQNGPTM